MTFPAIGSKSVSQKNALWTAAIALGVVIAYQKFGRGGLRHGS